MKTQMIAQTIKDAGFKTQVVGNVIEVSLSNRQVGRQEVQTMFDNDDMESLVNVNQTTAGVIVTIR